MPLDVTWNIWRNSAALRKRTAPLALNAPGVLDGKETGIAATKALELPTTHRKPHRGWRLLGAGCLKDSLPKKP